MMKIIEKLSNIMEEELESAEEYINLAYKCKDNDVLLAKMYLDMSADELKHAMLIHENAVRLINEYKNTGENVPPGMQAIYDYLHERHMDKYNAIKMLHATYK